MEIAAWSAVVGLLLIVMALGDSLLARLPLSTSMLYLAVGAAGQPALARLDLARGGQRDQGARAARRDRGPAVAVRLGPEDERRPARRSLAAAAAARDPVDGVTVALVAGVGVLALGLPLGAAILLGGILAPTDPVLASDVQVANPDDRDRLRFALTGEAGLNDGTAFPLVLLGLGLLGLHEIGSFGWRWLAVDMLWAVSAGVVIGAVLGTAVGQLVLYLRRTHKEAVGLDNFLALGLVGLAYGAAGLAHAYGFLAVFAAGVALRRLEQLASARAAGAAPAGAPSKGSEGRRRRSAEVAAEAHADPDASHADQVATHPKHAPAFMAHAMLAFNEQIERIGEVVAVIAVGMLLWAVEWRLASWGFVAALLLVIRPVSVAVGLIGSSTSARSAA
jgi:NhaP-type Na+/H+ or K+/H+ antiporter